jgi:hypothetical protein
MDIKVLVATHKKYQMPTEPIYIPIQVGREINSDIGYRGDNTGENISIKNPYYCELTALYWGIKNLNCDYIGLSHYRRHFSNRRINNFLKTGDFDEVLDEKRMRKLLINNDIILPKKRNYYIESVYSHYSHTHYSSHLDKTREIILEYSPNYVKTFDNVMKRKCAHMFNMFIMKKELADEYCNWLFSILGELEKRVDYYSYDAFEARLFGRVSELLLDVWIEQNKLSYVEVPYVHMEKTNWIKKGKKFLESKYYGRKLSGSF